MTVRSQISWHLLIIKEAFIKPILRVCQPQVRGFKLPTVAHAVNSGIHEQSTLSQDALSQHGCGTVRFTTIPLKWFMVRPTQWSCLCVFRRRRRIRNICNTECRSKLIFSTLLESLWTCTSQQYYFKKVALFAMCLKAVFVKGDFCLFHLHINIYVVYIDVDNRAQIYIVNLCSQHRYLCKECSNDVLTGSNIILFLFFCIL